MPAVSKRLKSDRSPRRRDRVALMDVYERLYEHFGPQHWWPAETRFEVIIGAILTQSAAWGNVEKALDNLKRTDALKPAAMRGVSLSDLAQLVYPSGYYNSKAKKIKAFVEHLGLWYGDDLRAMFTRDTSELRKELLSIHGIGEETADSIILYAAHKPIFVIDAYTRRIFSRLGRTPGDESYRAYQRMFEVELPRDTELFNEYHALLVTLGKRICRKLPLCGECCLRPVCPVGSDGGDSVSL